MGFLSFIARLLGLGRRWNGTPEQYLAMVQYMTRKNNSQYTHQEFLQWGELMQQVMKVKLGPYTSFKDLLERGTPDYSQITKIDGKLSELHQRIDLKQAIYGPDVNLGDDDVMTSQSEGAIFARNMVKDLSQHFRFSDEDQRKIDEL